MKCKRRVCTNDAGTYLYRSPCRTHRAAIRKAWLASSPEQRQNRNKQSANHYRKSQTPKAIAYRERHKKALHASSDKWIAANRAQRRLMNTVNDSVHKGRVKKPTACDGYGRAAELVAWAPVMHRGLDRPS